MTTVHEQGENWISCVKGAPDVILKRCRYEMEEDKIVPLTRERRTEIEAEITRMSARALRVLAGAYRELQTGKMPDGKWEKQVGQLEQNLIFLGLAGMMDPPREAAAGAVEAFPQGICADGHDHWGSCRHGACDRQAAGDCRNGGKNA